MAYLVPIKCQLSILVRRATTSSARQQESQSQSQVHRVKTRAFSRTSPSAANNISDAVTIKEGNLFFLSAPNGSVPCRANEGYGLYYQDCRFLDCWEARINGQPLTSLMASAATGYAAQHDLTNRAFSNPDGTEVPARTISAHLERTLEHDGKSESPVLHDVLTITNYRVHPVEFDLTLHFGADFADVFEVRQLVASQPSVVSRQVIDSSTVVLASKGIDNKWRSASLNFLQAPTTLTDAVVTYHLRLAPDEQMTLEMAVILAIGETPETQQRAPKTRAEIATLQSILHQSQREWLGHMLGVDTSNELFNLAIQRSLRDLRVLRSQLDGDQYFAAGLPWFGTLFGRDSIITALQTLAYDSIIAEKTIRLLARLQGTRVDEWKDEQPGKILHELRVGPLARADKIPSPYYGTVDATPLFLILVSEHYAWTGDLTLFRDLRPQIDAALHWIDAYGDIDGDGFVEYSSAIEGGYLVNQGWKDSGDAIVNADGSLAVPPIALVEVQGYVYRAKSQLASVFDASGESGIASRLRHEAAALKQAFNDQFWLPDQGIYALALQKDKRPAAVMSSNAGQALWGGIADSRRAPLVAQRLMDRAMSSGWGTRTLAAGERRYNPVGYHLGTIWPHDNSLIAAGLRQYGCDDDALRLFTAVFNADTHFGHYRMPELYAGYPQGEANAPALYPVACHPQAWAAGSIPFVLQICLGLAPNAAARRLLVVRPRLPSWLEHVNLRGLQVGDSVVDLEFDREETGVQVQVTRQVGQLNVICTDEIGDVQSWR